MEKFLHKTIYSFLVLALFVSFFIFIRYQLSGATEHWHAFGRWYFYVLVAYTWYIFFLLFIDDMDTRQYPSYQGEKISVIMPCYNERPEMLAAALQSILVAEGNKEIIVIDDGSTIQLQHILQRYAASDNVKIIRFSKNKGKRHAIHYAVVHMVTGRYVVTVDSDTILDAHALVRIVEPLKNENIGAATGDVRLLNEGVNWLTKMVGAYYWVGLNIYKRAQSALGMVVCCSGCLSAYRTDIFKEIIDEFVNQRFFQEPCTHSEDRHLTNLVLKRGYHVVYQERAVSYTETPSTFIGFIKQQQRWKRGYIRESIYTLTYAWRSRKVLFLEIVLWDLTYIFITFGIRLAVLISVITNPIFFLTIIFPGWLYYLVVRYIFLLFYAPKKMAGLLYYTILYEFVLYWQNIYALFTLKNKSWITR